MKKNEEKLQKQYCVHLDDASACQLEKLARYYHRNASELLRLLVLPVLINEYAKIMTTEHKDNAQKIQPAIFKKD